MQKAKSELTVITRAKELCAYTIEATQKSPKKFRFTFVTRLQDLAPDVIEQLYLANETYVTGSDAAAKAKRLEYRHKALTCLKLLNYFAMLAMEQNCILPKQYEQIARLSEDSSNLPGAWIRSDRKRLAP